MFKVSNHKNGDIYKLHDGRYAFGINLDNSYKTINELVDSSKESNDNERETVSETSRGVSAVNPRKTSRKKSTKKNLK